MQRIHISKHLHCCNLGKFISPLFSKFHMTTIKHIDNLQCNTHLHLSTRCLSPCRCIPYYLVQYSGNGVRALLVVHMAVTNVWMTFRGNESAEKMSVGFTKQ